MSQVIEFTAPTGNTLTLSLLAAGSDTLEASATDLACTERTNKKFFYTATVPTNLNGLFDISIKRGGNPFPVVDQVELNGQAGTFQANSIKPFGTTSETATAVNAILADDFAGISSGGGGSPDLLTLTGDPIDDALISPASVSADGVSVSQRSAADIIALDKYKAAKAAASSNPNQGLRFNKLVPPGAV